MKRVYGLDVYKLAEELSEGVCMRQQKRNAPEKISVMISVDRPAL
jgi:hypothetical protein